MEKDNPTDALNSHITMLKQKKDQDFIELKQQLKLTGESLKPANLVKGAVKDIATSNHVKSILIKAAIGFAVGYLAKRLLTKQRKNIKKRLLGNAIQFGLSFLLSKRNNLIKAAGIFAANQIIEAIKRRRLERRHLKDGEPLAETAQA